MTRKANVNYALPPLDPEADNFGHQLANSIDAQPISSSAIFDYQLKLDRDRMESMMRQRKRMNSKFSYDELKTKLDKHHDSDDNSNDDEMVQIPSSKLGAEELDLTHVVAGRVKDVSIELALL